MQRRLALAKLATLALIAPSPQGRAEVPGGALTPQDSGAVGNGIANDTRPLQRLFDRARASGAEVHLTPGPCAISSYLLVRNVMRAIVGHGGAIRGEQPDGAQRSQHRGRRPFAGQQGQRQRLRGITVRRHPPGLWREAQPRSSSNRISSKRAVGEAMLQAYVGVEDNQFIDNEVDVTGTPQYLAYCAVHAQRNEFRGHLRSGKASRAAVALGSAWRWTLLHRAYYGFLKGPGNNGFARAGSSGNHFVGHVIECAGDSPAIFLAQVGGMATPLTDTVLAGNRIKTAPGQRQLELVQETGGQLSALSSDIPRPHVSAGLMASTVVSNRRKRGEVSDPVSTPRKLNRRCFAAIPRPCTTAEHRCTNPT